jgi:phytoene dehydrogenase-like protein
MTLFDTLDHYISEVEADLEGLAIEIREETNFEDNAIEYLSEMYDTVKEHRDNLFKIKSELKRLQRYDDEISKEMPEDYKDWWQNSKEEWPLITRLTLEGRRESIDQLYDDIDHLRYELAGEDL